MYLLLDAMQLKELQNVSRMFPISSLVLILHELKNSNFVQTYNDYASSVCTHYTEKNDDFLFREENKTSLHRSTTADYIRLRLYILRSTLHSLYCCANNL